MQKYFSNHSASFFAVIFAVFLIVSGVKAATTISTNIQTDGTLSAGGGITIYASSTIGTGAQAGGLTTYGGATTTGNAYIAGRLGIGTSNPLWPLDVRGVQGAIQATNSYQLMLLRAQSSLRFTGYNIGNIRFGGSVDSYTTVPIGAAINAYTETNGTEWSSSNSPAALVFQTVASNTGQNLISRMMIGPTGLVGIGSWWDNSAEPSNQLDISLSSDATAKTSAFSGVNVSNTATSSTASIIKSGVRVASTGNWTGSGASNIGLYVSSVTGGTNNYDAIFNGGGNVGIGTTTPATKLQVSSGASATTTVTIGDLGLTSSKGCVNMNRSDGGAGSFYLNSSGVLVSEANYCR